MEKNRRCSVVSSEGCSSPCFGSFHTQAVWAEARYSLAADTEMPRLLGPGFSVVVCYGSTNKLPHPCSALPQTPKAPKVRQSSPNRYPELTGVWGYRIWGFRSEGNSWSVGIGATLSWCMVVAKLRPLLEVPQLSGGCDRCLGSWELGVG